MKKGINRVSDFVNHIAVAVACAAILATALSCFLQVFTRYVLNNSLSWTEELCRYMAIVVYMFGFSIATKHGSNPKIDLLSNLLKGKGKIVHALFCFAATCICGGFIVFYGIKALPMGARSVSSVLKIPASYMYWVIIISQLFCIIHSISGIVNDVEKLRQKEG